MHSLYIAGIKTKHDRDFVASRGPGNLYVVLCCANDCMFYTKDGYRRASAGNCFIKSPDFPERHYTPDDCNEGFINDWIHIESDTLGELIEELGIEANTVLPTKKSNLIRGSIYQIMSERETNYPMHLHFIDNLITEMMLIIARELTNEGGDNATTHSENLVALRRALLDEYNKNWTVKMMADRISLSESRFSVLYKKRFGISPTNDLIAIRIRMAKALLLSTDDNILSIATQCGFSSEYYFSRIFKAKEGVSPGAYRKN